MEDNKIVVIEKIIFKTIPKRKYNEYLNKCLKEEIKGKDFYVDGKKIIANKYTVGK